jgi:hypothetical protein
LAEASINNREAAQVRHSRPALRYPSLSFFYPASLIPCLRTPPSPLAPLRFCAFVCARRAWTTRSAPRVATRFGKPCTTPPS